MRLIMAAAIGISIGVALAVLVSAREQERHGGIPPVTPLAGGR